MWQLRRLEDRKIILKWVLIKQVMIEEDGNDSGSYLTAVLKLRVLC